MSHLDRRIFLDLSNSFLYQHSNRSISADSLTFKLYDKSLFEYIESGYWYELVIEHNIYSADSPPYIYFEARLAKKEHRDGMYFVTFYFNKNNRLKITDEQFKKERRIEKIEKVLK